MKIVLDTSFLIDCAINKIHIQEELTRILNTAYSTAIIDKTLQELENIKKKEAVKLAKTLLKAMGTEIIKTKGGHADKLLLEIADKEHIIATQDKELRQKLKKKKQPHITIRQKKLLALIT